MLYNHKMDKNKEMLLKKINYCGLVLNDLNLFLDTHPDSKKALKLFGEHQHKLAMYEAEYEKKYGSLTACVSGGGETEEKWEWLDGPWPWEREANYKTAAKE